MGSDKEFTWPEIVFFSLRAYSTKTHRHLSNTTDQCNLAGVLFRNIDIAAPSVLGEPDVLWGAPDAKITDLIFDNVSIGGKRITSLDHFKHNEHVQNITFK